MKARKLVRIGLVLVLLAVLAVGLGFGWLFRTGRPARSGSVALFELAGPVTVRFDSWAVPHVEAQNVRDLAMAMGWLHASERMVQMELGRRSAFGRLSEILGGDTIALDREALELRLGETAERLVDSLSVEHRGLLEAYALGVNSWLDRNKSGLPPELAVLRVKPKPWRVADSLAFMLLLSRDLSYPMHFEELRWQWLARAGAERLRDVSGGTAIDVDPEIAAYVQAHAQDKPESPTSTEPVKNGSNSWALGSSRTKNEAPLVANDPHLSLGVPSLWYQALLRSPEYEAMGMTVPGMPFVIIGQNANLAWSFTNTELDTNDLFVEELSSDGASVRRGEQFVPLTREKASIPVRGKSPLSIDLFRSDIGPFFPADRAHGLPPRSLAWTSYEVFDPLDAFYGLARAQSVADVPAVCASFVCPVQNIVFADRRGGLAFTLLGRVPDRAAGDGRLPLPAWNPARRWRGLRPASDNPRINAPVEDFLATANNDVRPPGFALDLPAEFDMDFRVQRIRERIVAGKAWWPADVAEVQADVTSLYARRVVALLPETVEGEAAFARRALVAWDGTMEVRGAAALFVLFEREFFTAVYGDELAQFKLTALPGFSRGESLLAALDGSLPPVWFDDLSTNGRVETLVDALQGSLTRAWREGSKRFGREVLEWDYGELHTWTLRHPLDAMPFGERFLDRGPFPMPGSSTTIAAFSGRWRGDHMEVTHGPSMRWIADTGNPDRSMCVLPAGQSGHPADDHYADQLPVFRSGKTHAMQWSEAAIAKATVSTLTLTP
ncbi:MAG TPA: penicillin acylase family protein [Planctomycetota bacterium]|nr:penicillin acylase family protein [Planctomycetota bacterium]